MCGKEERKLVRASQVSKRLRHESNTEHWPAQALDFWEIVRFLLTVFSLGQRAAQAPVVVPVAEMVRQLPRTVKGTG